MLDRIHVAIAMILTALSFGATAARAQAQHSDAPALVVGSEHSSIINAIAYEPQGRWLASAGADSSIKIWEAATGRLLRTLVHHRAEVSALAISSDAKLIASVSGLNDRRAIVWNPATGEVIATIADIAPGQDNQPQSGVAFSSDDRSIFTLSYTSINRWDIKSGRLIQAITRQQKQYEFNIWEKFAVSQDLQVIAAADSKQLLLLDARSGRTTHSLGPHPQRRFNSTVFADTPKAMTFSPDTNLIAVAYDEVVRVFSVKSGRLVHTLNLPVSAVAFAPDSRSISFALRSAVSSRELGLQLWDVQDWRLVRKLAEGEFNSSVVYSPDGRAVVGGSSSPKAWNANTGAPLDWLTSATGPVVISSSRDDRWMVAGPVGIAAWNGATGRMERLAPMQITPHATAARDAATHTLFASPAGMTIQVLNATTGAVTKTLRWEPKPNLERPCPACGPYHVSQPTLSPDGRWLAAILWGDKSAIRVWDLSSGLLLHTLPSMVAKDNSGYYAVDDMIFSPDSTSLWVATPGSHEGSEGVRRSIRVWDVATGKLLKTLAHPFRKELPYAPAPHLKTLSLETHGIKAIASDMRRIAVAADSWKGRDGRWGTSIALLDGDSGKLVREFQEDTSRVSAVAFSKNDESIFVGVQGSHQIKVWEAATGRLQRTLEGNPGNPYSLAQSADGNRILAGNVNGTSAVWDFDSGRQLALSLHPKSGEWLTMTPEGFFAASSPGAGDSLSIVRGFEVFTVDQIYQALFNPDLVREKLANDPNGEVENAAGVLDLSKLLGSGQAPQVALSIAPRTSNASDETVVVDARVVDQGGGIGRIEWRLNGVTVGIANAEHIAGAARTVSRRLYLESGNNTIEVVAYNARNLLASRPARTAVAYKGGGGDPIKPKLHVLAIGINDYIDAGWVPPGTSQSVAFGKLALAVNDARTFAAELKKAATGRYSDVGVTIAVDGDATAANLERIVDRLAQEVHPRDTVMLFAAAHGISDNGRFFLIPQDYQGGPDSLVQRAIGQDRLQEWIGDRLQARKVLILLDTCESGALVSGYGRSRANDPVSEAAIGRLHEATGRPVLTAAAEGKPAFEGHEGHGVFTWALLDSLRNGDRNNNGVIELSELVAHVQEQVPKISAKLNGRGRAAVAARGSVEDFQSARFGSRGEDFALVDRLQ